jgi:hypothetical protein
MLSSTSSTLPEVLRRQASTYIYIRSPHYSLRNYPVYTYGYIRLHTCSYSFIVLQLSPQRQASTYIYIRLHLYSPEVCKPLRLFTSTSTSMYSRLQNAHLLPTPSLWLYAARHLYVFSGPSLALSSRWQRVHGYTSLIRPRLQSSPT